MKHWVLSLSVLLLLSVVYAAGQDNTPFVLRNSPRRMQQTSFNSLNGSVRTVGNKPVRNVRVEVRSLHNGEAIASGYTLPNGTFEFTNLPRGVYEVVASVGVYEARERVEVYQPDVSVHLRLPEDNLDASASNGSATVSVTQFKVPDKARKLFAKAEEALRKQKLPQAREEVEKALQVFPTYAQALTLRGILNLQDNKLQEARTDLEQAVKYDYGYAMGYIVLGATYNLMNRFDDAARVLERGIVLKPASWQAYFEMSKAQLGKGQFEAALQQTNKASELGPPNYPPIHLVRAHALLGLKSYDRAVSELEQFLTTDPNGADSARARYTLNQVRSFMARGK